MKENSTDSRLKELLQDKFSDEYLAPPPTAWTNIEKSMAVSDGRRKPFFFYWILAGLLLFLGTAAFFMLINDAEPKTLLAKNERNMQEKVNTKVSPKTGEENKTNPTLDDEKSPKSKSSNGSEQDVNSGSGNSTNELAQSNSSSKSTTRRKNTSLNTSSEFSRTSFSKSSNVSNVSPPKAAGKLNSSNVSPTKSAAKLNLPTPIKTAENDAQKEGQDKETIIVPKQDILATNDNGDAEKAEDKNNDIPPTSDKETDSTLMANKEAEQDSSGSIEKDELPLPAIESEILKKWEYDFFLGLGRSPRRNSNFSTVNSIILTDNVIRFKNRTIGMNFRYQLYPHLGLRTGFAFGANRFVTRLFPVSVANDKLNQELEIGTSDGVLRTSSLSANGLSANGTDTSTYLMRVIHRSGYISIPVSIYFNTLKKPNQPYFYVSTGFDSMIRGRERNLLIVRSDGLDNSFSLSRNTRSGGLAVNWHTNLGLTFPVSKSAALFTEFNYAYNLTNGLKNNYLKTKYSYFQWTIGVRF